MSSLLGKLGLSRWAEARKPQGTVDAIAGGRIAGWAAAAGGVEVEAWIDGVCRARTRPDLSRPDVAEAWPNLPGAALSGFALDLPEAASASGTSELRIVAKPFRRWSSSLLLANETLVDEALTRRAIGARDGGLHGPFPKPVIDMVAALWPEDSRDARSAAGQARVLDRVLQMMAVPALGSLPALADYARYLTATLAHCQFVQRHFPGVNAAAAIGAADSHCKPNSVNEMFAIIHQLFVLKSWGVSGDFAEFGCFKGYSSSMLSFACAQLGIRMHVFDSFEGLPPSAGSGYEAGQYAGSIDEVRDHVRRFGVIAAVEFHPGFFADSLRDYRPPPLMCLWMDVDLESSAIDLLVVADRLDPRGTLFSHECKSAMFRDGAIVTDPRPDNPIHPLVARFNEIERPLTGQYVAGYTGAFWPIANGTPALSNVALRRLMLAFG